VVVVEDPGFGNLLARVRWRQVYQPDTPSDPPIAGRGF
jgi:hypothetical protein